MILKEYYALKGLGIKIIIWEFYPLMIMEMNTQAMNDTQGLTQASMDGNDVLSAVGKV